AQVYLIEPEVAEERARAASKRKGVTLPSLQAEADGNGIGEMFRRVREGTQGVLLARPYPGRVFYVVQLADGGQRTVLIVWSELPEEGGGMSFRIHATRFNEFRSVSKAQLLEWLPERTYGADVTGWSGSSAAEKASAEGLGGTFQSVEEVETFLAGLRTLRES
ncbi:MAG: hypothetical protein OXP10_04965, partial [Chloroflexota bacterium]|nr:hypothetical protein [Chloroflexota bacterium]